MGGKKCPIGTRGFEYPLFTQAFRVRTPRPLWRSPCPVRGDRDAVESVPGPGPFGPRQI